MNKLEQLKQILDTALQGAGKSKLTEDVIGRVGGFISPNNRHLFNNLGSISTHYAEFGSHCGSSLISTVYGNDNLKSAIGVDLFVLFNEEHNVRDDLFSHCETFIPGQYKIVEKDFYTTNKEDLPYPIDLYLYDGGHSYDEQRKGITHIVPFLADQAIIVVDDGIWEEPNAGTMKGLMESGLNIDYLVTLDSGVRSDCSDRGFWNGLIVCLVSKPK
jgi:hypothetical protein